MLSSDGFASLSTGILHVGRSAATEMYLSVSRRSMTRGRPHRGGDSKEMAMRRISKKRAIELCREMSAWLVINPGKRKGTWPGIICVDNKSVHPYYGLIRIGCFACHYASQTNQEKSNDICYSGDVCSECFLLPYWVDGIESCMHNKSAYCKWSDSCCYTEDGMRDRSKYATIIVDHCDDLIVKKAWRNK